MKVSIITPYFNSGEYFKELATSVLNQTHSNWEWIIVDDGSSERELNVVQQIAESDPRIQCIPRSKDRTKGACACRNSGIEWSSGDYIIFLDADDYLSPRCLEDRLAAIRNLDPSWNRVLYFKTIAFKDGDPRRLLWDDTDYPVDWLESLWSLTPPCQSSGPFWPTGLVKQIGGWNENMMVWQDLEIHTRAYAKGIRFISAQSEKPDVFYRLSPKSLSHQNFHSSEKTTSRLNFLNDCLRLDLQLSEGQEKSLKILAYSVLKGVIAQRRWDDAKTIRQESAKQLGNRMHKTIRSLTLAHRLRLYKIPFAQSRLRHFESRLKGKLERKILTRPYQKRWPSVSIVIPTYNAEAWLKQSLPHFLEQSYEGDWELLVIDSGSTDGTLRLLEPHQRIRVHAIPNNDFGHGKTRNLAASLSNCELLLFTVQDACPRSPNWLSRMVNDLLAFNLDAVCGGQAVPHDRSKNPVQWYRPVSETSEVEIVHSDAFIQWNPEQQMRACRWDNVNALYTREALLKNPFEDVRFGEDMAWAKAHLSTGGSIGYAQANKVWHYHHQHPGFTRKRVLNQLYWRHKTFSALPPLAGPPTFLQFFKTLKAITVHAGIWNLVEVIRWLVYNNRLQKESHQAGREFLQAALKGPKELNNLYDSLGTASPMATKSQN